MSPHEEGALAARAVSASYGSLVVCREITLDVRPGEVVALIGPNGAGKTSFIGALTGAVASKGEIALGATRLDGRPIHARTRLGLATVPDNRGLFAPLTVAENIRLGAMFVARERRTEVVALIGPNGAGKTSFIGALTGAVASKGEIALGATRLDGRPIHARTRLGLATVPDNRGLFAPLTVAENIRLGAMFVARERRTEVVERAMSYFPFLAERGATLAGSLSGGQQQMLAIAKCLAGDPRVLLLDEPSQGLAPIILDEIVKVIGELKARRLPVLLVEQNYGLVERTADRFAVMLGGRIVMTGGKAELADRDRIGRLFLERRRHTPTVH